MTHPNEELVRRGYEAFSKGDMETLRELFDPEIVWHFPGRSVLAGDHRGTDAVLGFFARTAELTAGTFRVEVHEVVADDQHTVGLHLATGEREGRTLEDREVLVFHVRDGKVVEAWQYIEDQYAYDEFFWYTLGTRAVGGPRSAAGTIGHDRFCRIAGQRPNKAATRHHPRRRARVRVSRNAWLQPIPRGEPPMGFAGTLVRDRGTIALQHGPGFPACQPHEVGLATALAEPEVGEGVPEQVGVEVLDAGLPAAAAEELGDAGVSDAALAADPEPLQLGVWMASAGAEVLVQRLAGPVAKRQRTIAAALAGHDHHVVLEVEVTQAHAGDLGQAAAGVQQQQDQGAVAAGLEVPPGTGRQQPAQQVLGEHRGGLLGHSWRLHLGHRVGGDLAFLLQPGIEDPQGAVAVGRGGGLPAG